ncbi:hypothetical protein PstZobell_15484 [Stutzerimonas stutzeri ATCC 14405 = CCUG 16156]|uniref:DUF4126 family protein n=1 Tax=Stutzerimonas stutzeri TaxID=316 RepID=UPI00025494E9|nr:DUF4126 family protein [Stutzerimonas stutzeri]EHY78827.1 hypothetical protein PstZobell_15484 [Stutzerimonas stutzeri ATCC 14405 = CCUG 16156]QOZ94000.1 DUF4126 family protein [Stutzerimonas stutzeri]
MTTSSNLLWAALAIGAVTGMRSMLAPALVSRALSERNDLDGAGEAAQLLTSDTAQTFLPVLAASEMIGDKMPFAPDRTIVPSMMFRALSGGVSAAALAGVRREPMLVPALLGATAALVASKIGLSLRKPYQPRSMVNAALGAVEEGLALMVGRAGLRRALGDGRRGK